MIVKEQKDIELVNDCECIAREEQLKAAILFHTGSRPVARIKHVFLHGKYPAISIHGKKIHVHRLMVQWVGNCTLQRGEYVHHINGNKLDNRLENLELMTAEEHQRLTNKGRKQTPEWIKKRITKTADAKRGKKYPKRIYENPRFIKSGEGSMTYELAKRLREAGFPGSDQWHLDKGELHYHPEEIGPTLSELIEACGNGFFGLNRLEKDQWSCHFMEDENASGEPVYKTPEEAVANLWLELNKGIE